MGLLYSKVTATARQVVSSLATALGRLVPQRTRAVLGILAGGVALSGLVFATAPANEPVPRTEKAWPVSTLEARMVDASPELLLFGRIETPRSADLTAAVAAEVLEVPVEEGQRVELGDLLVRLDPRDAQLTVAQRRAELATAQAALDALDSQHASDRNVLARQREIQALLQQKLGRHQQLREADMLPAARLDEVRREAERQAILLRTNAASVAGHEAAVRQSQALVELAQAQLDRAKLDLERTNITAPFAGRVASVSIAPGEQVARGVALLELYDTGALEVRAQVPSQFVGELRAAMTAADAGEGPPVSARMRVDGQPIELRLDRLGGRVARSRSGVDALFEVESAGASLELGRVVELDVALPTQSDVIAVPVQAVYRGSRIYKVDGERLHGVEIERVGERTDSAGRLEVLVRSPELVDGDIVAVTQLPRAIDGLLVALRGNLPQVAATE